MAPLPRVVLVALTWSRDKDPRVPLGHASLHAALAAAGDIVVVPVCHAVNAPGPSVAAMAAELVGLAGPAGDIAIGVYVWNEHVVQQLLRALRRESGHVRIILGGPQISYAGPGVEALYADADVFIRGYAEEALVEVARSPVPRPIPGVHWRGEPDLAGTAVADLSRLPSPWLVGAVAVPEGGFVRMETQRGCPFRCSFCQHREAGARLRKRDFDGGRVHDELVLFTQRGVREIAVLDPIFNAGNGALEVLGTLRALGFTGLLSLQCRFEMVTDAFLDACEGLDVLLEFGLQTVHPAESKVVERSNNLGKVADIMARLEHRRLRYLVSLIFGLPEQTVASFRESIDFCLRHRVPIIRAFPLMLLRGTPLERDRARWGLAESDDPIPMVVAARTFDRDAWTRMARLSDALKRTEGHHPSTVRQLADLADPPDLGRWTPAPGCA